MILEFAYAVTSHMTEGDFNEKHLAFRIYEDNVFATMYENSEYGLSFGVGYTFDFDYEGRDFFVDTALVTGYDASHVVPMVRAGIEFRNFRAWVAPSINRERDLFVIFGFETYFTIGD